MEELRRRGCGEHRSRTSCFGCFIDLSFSMTSGRCIASLVRCRIFSFVAVKMDKCLRRSKVAQWWQSPGAKSCIPPEMRDRKREQLPRCDQSSNLEPLLPFLSSKQVALPAAQAWDARVNRGRGVLPSECFLPVFQAVLPRLARLMRCRLRISVSLRPFHLSGMGCSDYQR